MITQYNMRLLHTLSIVVLVLAAVSCQVDLSKIHVNPNLRAPPLDSGALDLIKLHSMDTTLEQADQHLNSLKYKKYVPMSHEEASSHTYESYLKLFASNTVEHDTFHVDASYTDIQRPGAIEDCGCETPAPTVC